MEFGGGSSHLLNSKTGEPTSAYGTGAGIVTTSPFDDVVDWYRKNFPAGWHSTSIGDFGQLTQQATQGPSGDIMKLLKGEMPGAASTNGNTNPAAPKVRVALFKAPTSTAGSPDSAGDTPGSAASTRADWNREDANWICFAASLTVDITESL